MEMYTGTVVGGLLSSGLPLIGWIIAVVLVTIMLRRGGARAERFLLAGTLLMLFQSLIAMSTASIVTWLTTGGEMSNVEIASVWGLFGLVRGLISLAGIICLVYAFWVKFKSANWTFSAYSLYSWRGDIFIYYHEFDKSRTNYSW